MTSRPRVGAPGVVARGVTTRGMTTRGVTTPGPSTLSVKLSALHPRYEQAQEARVYNELYSSLIRLLTFAREKNVGFTIDAEEMDRLELSLQLFEKLYRSGFNKGWGQLGIVVQTYSIRALLVLVWLNALAADQGEAIPVRLVKGAYSMEANVGELMALCCREACKTLQDSIDEIREAVDFFRYYAQQARRELSRPLLMPGPTGETNELYMEGRGVFVCISPWNFPLAIFTGQLVAALVAGNALIVKPAEQTSLIAYRAVQLLFTAGLPKAVLQFLPGEGSQIGPKLRSDPRVSGVVFTGSTQTAHIINRTLAARNGAIGLLIAEHL